MKWQTMTKEQKQKAVLAVLVAVAVLVAIQRFALTPLMQSRENAGARRDELRQKVVQAQEAIKNEVRTETEMREMRPVLERIFSQEMPPPDNALSWATQFINTRSRQLGLDVVSVAEVEAGGGGWLGPDLAKRNFKAYGVRVELSCSFLEVQKLVRALHESSPYLAVSGISVMADQRSPEKHQVTLTLEWPSWKDSKQGQQPFNNHGGGAKEKEPEKKHG